MKKLLGFIVKLIVSLVFAVLIYIRTAEETPYSCIKMKMGKPSVLKYKAQMQKNDIKAWRQEQATACFLLQSVLQQKRIFLKVR